MSEPDRREEILARLLVIAAGIPGVKEAFRNRLDIHESRRPAVVILDADETVEVANEVRDGRGRAAGVAPIIATMTPEMYIVLGDKPEDVGTALNAIRIRLIKAVLRDETLIGLSRDGDIRYLGFATGLASGRSMEGEAGISFQFSFIVRPEQL